MEGQEEEENLLEPEDSVPRPQKGQLQFKTVLIILSLFVNIVFGTYSLSRWGRERFGVSAGHQPSYEHGFTSELEPARNHIELIAQSFKGGVELNSDGSFIMDREGHEYVGKPGPAVDEAWDKLLGGLNLDFDKTEVDLSKTTFQWPESGLYFSGLDVFHSLHCLNRLRQAIYPDYYVHAFDSPLSPSRDDHIGHCINHIRQAIQCHSDLTPMEWKLVNSNKLILETETQHTCRNFDKIREWAGLHRTRFWNIESWRNASLQIID
ncbi:hypothetical protein F5Y16DRAFT_398077 [Xylariaceae sp. FL0255]|nr:hypothetical protein F5Y16DRAFT_398077 [Xylariaceae sp. FL0255]